MENEVIEKQHHPNYCFTIHKDEIRCSSCAYPECFRARLLEADTSLFHTDQLAEATRSINKILSEILPEIEGQSLAFIQSKAGIMLVWVTPKDRANGVEDKNGVTSSDDTDTLAKALNLKNYK